jgi:hypothetical protein
LIIPLIIIIIVVVVLVWCYGRCYRRCYGRVQGAQDLLDEDHLALEGREARPQGVVASWRRVHPSVEAVMVR